MKIVVTGSLGNISKPLAARLVEQAQDVIVITSKPGKQQEIEAIGATAAVGSLEDADFLTATFTGVDAVYCMVPPNNYFDHKLDLHAYYQQLGSNYAQAIGRSGVKRVVNLSSIGAHLEKGSGILIGAHDVEKTLNALAPGITITHIRPTSFYYNLYAYADMIKKEGLIAANYGGDNKITWVSPIDIAAAVAEELLSSSTGRKVRYVASEELTGNETAAILGEAIGKPGLKWNVISNEQTRAGLEAAGMNPRIAAGLVEMYASFHNGILSEDYYRNRPAVLGKVKLTDFAREFAATIKWS